MAVFGDDSLAMGAVATMTISVASQIVRAAAGGEGQSGGGRGRRKFLGHPTVRVAAGMDFLKSLDADVGVDLSGVESGVAQHLLDVADVRAVLMHVGGAGMAKQMRRFAVVTQSKR